MSSKSGAGSIGFTLIELLVVITIITILGSIGLTIYSSIQPSARDAIRKKDLQTLSQALEIYAEKFGKYPPASSDNPASCSRDTDSFYQVIAPLISNSTVPVDPLLNSKYCYISENKGGSFRLFAKLENSNDSEIVPNCSSSNYNYSLTSQDLTIICPP